MKKNCIFTICAKNYLAQALTLKESVLKHNDVDFFLFLSDKKTEEICDVDCIELNESWMPKYHQLAYLYNVIEFSTAVKPFAFLKIMGLGYEKIMYLDPDIYCVDSLDYILDKLEAKSCVLSPHYNTIMESSFNGAVPEETFLKDGVFNLGFAALKNNSVGRSIARWWADRLTSKCFSDFFRGYFTDQKWMDFIPCFYPEELYVCRHPGVNIAIWNLHERIISLTEENRYEVMMSKCNKRFPLLFYHFSGFDPFDRTVINRRHQEYNIYTYPYLKVLLNEYADTIYKNGYDRFSKMVYSYNYYDDNTKILPLHRRLYSGYVDVDSNPFASNSLFKEHLKSAKLLVNKKSKDGKVVSSNLTEVQSKGRIDRMVQKLLKLLLLLFGVEKYSWMIRLMTKYAKQENHNFLIRNK